MRVLKSFLSVFAKKSNKRFEESVAARYIKQVLEGVLYLHSMSVIHRDIKPENILISFVLLFDLSTFYFNFIRMCLKLAILAGPRTLLRAEDKRFVGLWTTFLQKSLGAANIQKKWMFGAWEFFAMSFVRVF